jgi:flavin reductase (DIM6/NTAB) family NADH-FMN oxidoreductase RutF
MAKEPFPLSKVYTLIETGPVVLLSTAGDGGPDVMPMSWHTMMDFEPPLIGCVVSNRNLTYQTLLRTKECAINIPTVEIAEQVVGCGNVSGRSTDKFEKFGLTAAEASVVKAPLVEECYANLECEVIDTSLAEKYNFFVLEVRRAWADPLHEHPKTIHHQGWDAFMVAGETIHIASRKK